MELGTNTSRNKRYGLKHGKKTVNVYWSFDNTYYRNHEIILRHTMLAFSRCEYLTLHVSRLVAGYASHVSKKRNMSREYSFAWRCTVAKFRARLCMATESVFRASEKSPAINADNLTAINELKIVHVRSPRARHRLRTHHAIEFFA